MQFDPDNKIVMLCAKGMELEIGGDTAGALKLFQQAWDQATDNLEKFTSAHYIARHQERIGDKLKWDQTALNLALKIDNDSVKGAYPSLYLNLAKCSEDMSDYENAGQNYQLALSFCHFLGEDGYGKMIKGGIMNGIDRISRKTTAP
jgi:tetratricopeptide (TPR) repeat protein